MGAETFKLDTSGEVGPMPGWAEPVPKCRRFLIWSDLSPFTQGYIEVLFASGGGLYWAGTKLGHPMARGFRHLAPETLQRIMADCERFEQRIRDLMLALPEGERRSAGQAFWITRNGGEGFAEWFPNHRIYYADTAREYTALSPYLSNDGLVRFQEPSDEP